MVLINLSSNAFETESFEYDNTLTLQDVKHDLLDDLELRDENDEIIEDELKVLTYIQTKEDKILLEDIPTTVLSKLIIDTSEINIYLDVDYIDEDIDEDSDGDGCSDFQPMSGAMQKSQGGGGGGGLFGFLGNAIGNYAADISQLAGSVIMDEPPAVKGFHSGFPRKKKNKPKSFHTHFKPKVGTKVKN